MKNLLYIILLTATSLAQNWGGSWGGNWAGQTGAVSAPDSSNYYYNRFIVQAKLMKDTLYAKPPTGGYPDTSYGMTWTFWDKDGTNGNYQITVSPVIYLIDALIEAYRADSVVADLNLAKEMYDSVYAVHGIKDWGIDGLFYDATGDTTRILNYIPLANRASHAFQTAAFYIAAYKLFEELGDSTYYYDFLHYYNGLKSSFNIKTNSDTLLAGYGGYFYDSPATSLVVNTSCPSYKVLAFATAKGLGDHTFATGDSMLWKIKNFFNGALVDSSNRYLQLYQYGDAPNTAGWGYMVHGFAEILEGMWYLREAGIPDEPYWDSVEWQKVVNSIYYQPFWLNSINESFGILPSMCWGFIKKEFNDIYTVPNTAGVQIANQFRNAIFTVNGFATGHHDLNVREYQRDFLQSLSKNVRFLKTTANLHTIFPALSDTLISQTATVRKFFHQPENGIYYSGSNITKMALYSLSGFQVNSSGWTYGSEVKNDSNLIVFTFTKADTTLEVRQQMPGFLTEFKVNHAKKFRVGPYSELFNTGAIFCPDTSDTINVSYFPSGDTTIVLPDSVLIHQRISSRFMAVKANTASWTFNKTANTVTTTSPVTRVLIYARTTQTAEDELTLAGRNFWYQTHKNTLADIWSIPFSQACRGGNTRR